MPKTGHFIAMCEISYELINYMYGLQIYKKFLYHGFDSKLLKKSNHWVEISNNRICELNLIHVSRW